MPEGSAVRSMAALGLAGEPSVACRLAGLPSLAALGAGFRLALGWLVLCFWDGFCVGCRGIGLCWLSEGPLGLGLKKVLIVLGGLHTTWSVSS